MDEKLAPVGAITNQAAGRVTRPDHRVGFIVVDLFASDIKLLQHHEAASPPRPGKRSSLAFWPLAGDAGDEVLRICGEKLDLRLLPRAQRRFEVDKGEPPAQPSNSGLVRGTGIARCGNLKAGIAEVAMDDFAEHLARLEIGNNGVVELKGGSLGHTPRGSVLLGQVTGKRDLVALLRLLRHRVQAAVAHRISIGLEAALPPD